MACVGNIGTGGTSPASIYRKGSSPPPLYLAVRSLHVADDSSILQTSFAAAAAARSCFFDKPILDADSRPCTRCAPCDGAEAPWARKLSAEIASHSVSSLMIRIPIVATRCLVASTTLCSPPAARLYLLLYLYWSRRLIYGTAVSWTLCWTPRGSVHDEPW